MNIPAPFNRLDIDTLVRVFGIVFAAVSILVFFITGIKMSSGSGIATKPHVAMSHSTSNTPVASHEMQSLLKKEDTAQVVVDQGDNVRIGNYGMCSVGFIDNENRRLYTAAHCFFDNANPDNPKFGDAIYTMSGNLIGHYTSGTSVKTRYDKFGNRLVNVDTAEVTLVDGVYGENIHSGDTAVRWSDIDPENDIACFTGATTRKVVCGTIDKVNEEAKWIYLRADANSLGGDSGGPVWIPGKGFLGVISAGGDGKTSSKTVDNGAVNVFNNVPHHWTS